jgi:hypothetical protein
MFWRKRTYQDEELGSLRYEQNSWSGIIRLNQGNEIFVSVEGSKEQPFDESLSQTKNILKNIANYECEARRYLDLQDINAFKADAGDIIFDGIYSYCEAGKFDLYFGLSEWEDAFIIVHFSHNLPINISLGD